MQKRTGTLNFGAVMIMAAIMIFASIPTTGIAATENNKIPLEMYVYIPCTGDTIQLNGNLHDIFKITPDNNGGFLIVIHDNPQGISGVSLSTEETFRATGVTRGNTKIHADGSGIYSYTNNFHIVGKRGISYWVHENLLIQLNQDGSIDKYVDHFVTECSS
jgi:hypothetical protein